MRKIEANNSYHFDRSFIKHGLEAMTFSFVAVYLFISFATSSIANEQAIMPQLMVAQKSDEIEIPGTPLKSEAAKEKKTDGEEPEAGLSKNINTPEPPPEVLSSLEDLPFPARKMRELILEAAHSGDIEKLRPFIGYGDNVTMLALGGFDDDPIDFLKSISGDSEGHELLAIITEILESDFVFLDEGTDRAIYVWPYFYAYPLEKLSPEQRVKLFRLMTYGDYQEMKSFGAYIFYRIGITPEGRWEFLVAGD